MTRTYKVKEVLLRDLPEDRHRLWDILDKEDSIRILNKNPKLKYCREHYPDGLGTRKFDKLCEMNFGYDDRFDVVGYSVDAKGKVLRTWANKYSDYDYVSPFGSRPNEEGDKVCESVHWPPIAVGEPSKLLHNMYATNGFYWS